MSGPIVHTTLGDVEGTTRDDILVFRGIPYAAPPVGPRRFAPPAPAEAWTGTLDATRFGPVAPQNVGLIGAFTGAGAEIPQSEADCLTLNVFTPGADDERRPVMVWIHGGAFVIGDGRTPWYDGSHLARRDVVVVTLNYRLGALGFLHLDDLDDGERFVGSGNVGLLDQAAALAWVSANVEAFGGDPDTVTVFGESAGAMSTATLLGLPGAREHFHRAIAQSGATAHIHDRETATEVTRRFLDKLGLEPAQIDALRELSVDRILEAQQAVMLEHWGSAAGSLPFQPVVDHAVLHVHPLEAIEVGDADDVALLIGTTRDEMALFTVLDPTTADLDDDQMVARAQELLTDEVDAEALATAYRRRLGFDASAQELWTAILTDAVFRMPAIELADFHAVHQPDTYMYLFAYESTAFGGGLGACHAVDLPFTFDNLDAPMADLFVGTPTEESRALAAAVADAWTSFARSGRPRASGLAEWPRYDTAGRATMILDVESSVVDDPHAFERGIWAARR